MVQQKSDVSISYHLYYYDDSACRYLLSTRSDTTVSEHRSSLKQGP